MKEYNPFDEEWQTAKDEGQKDEEVVIESEGWNWMKSLGELWWDWG